jgi:hypothetical protein
MAKKPPNKIRPPQDANVRRDGMLLRFRRDVAGRDLSSQRYARKTNEADTGGKRIASQVNFVLLRLGHNSLGGNAWPRRGLELEKLSSRLGASRVNEPPHSMGGGELGV